MPKEVDGEELYTKEELEEKVEEVKGETQDQIDDLQKQIDEGEGSDEEKEQLAKDLESAKEELAKWEDKEKNWKNLRESKDEVANQLTETKTQLDDTNKRLDTFLDTQKNDTVNDYLADKDLDKDQKEKFDHYFKKFSAEAKDKNTILNAAKEAHILATTDTAAKGDDVTRNAPRHPGGNYQPKDGKTNESSESKEMRKDLSISDEDKKKYGDVGSIPLV